MVDTKLLIALFIVPIAIILVMRKGKDIGTNNGIPAARSTPNCNANTHWCTCPNGESWQMEASSTCGDCKQECYNRMGTPNSSGNSALDYVFSQPKPGINGMGTNLLQGTIQFPLSEKVAIPVFDESIDWNNHDFFDNFAHGGCRCSDYQCCYKAPYQSQRGDVRTQESCEVIYYGDKMQSCDNAFLNWQDDMYDMGIDENNAISHKINDKRFFYKLGYDSPRKNRHAYSGSRVPASTAYMNSAAHRPHNQRAFPANLNHNIMGQTRSSLYKILREKSAGKRLKYARLARKIL